MSVSDGQKANDTTFNNAYLSKTADSTGSGKYNLQNSDSASGGNITNIQREFNAIASFTGKTTNQAKTDKPTWSDNTYGTASDSLQDRVEAVQAGVQSNDSDLSNLESKSPTWTKYTVSYTDLSNAATTSTYTLFSLEAKGRIHEVVAKHSTSFSGGSISAYTIEVGPSGDSDKYLKTFDVFQATGPDKDHVNPGIESFTSSTNIIVTALSTGDNLDQATQGSVDIWVLQSTLP